MDASLVEEKSVIEELKQFNRDFMLKKEKSEEEEEEEAARETGKATVKQDSLELEQEKDELKSFQKSFKLCLTKNNNMKQKPDNTAAQHRTKKRRSRPPPRKSVEFTDLYSPTEDVLGKGARSCVTTCFRKSTNEEFAVKIVPKTSEREREKVLREIEILYLCRENRTILHLVETFEDKECFYLVFDKMAGGPLLSHIQRRERFTEREASQVVREVAEALGFLHQRGVAHRDLKPANILCERTDQVVPVRICDFDLSSIVPTGSSAHATPVSTPMLHTPVGSAEFMAPEVVDTFLGEEFSYNKKCDLWSLGVTLYMMLSGRPPFNGRCGQGCGWDKGENCPQCQNMLLAKIKNCEYSFHEEHWLGISDDAKDLIGQLLQTNAKLRPSAQQVLQHKWLQRGVPETPLQTPVILNRFPSIPNELSSYAASCILFERRLSCKASDSVDKSDCQKAAAPSSGSSPQPVRSFGLSPPGSSELAVRREATSA